MTGRESRKKAVSRENGWLGRFRHYFHNELILKRNIFTIAGRVENGGVIFRQRRVAARLCATLVATGPDNALVFLRDCLAFRVCALARDLDADARHVRENVQFFDPHPGFLDADILQAEAGNLLGKAFDKVDMPGGGDLPDAGDNRFITDDVFDPVGGRAGGFKNGQIDVDPDTLGASAFVVVHSDLAGKDEVANEDVAQRFANRFFRRDGGAGANKAGS